MPDIGLTHVALPVRSIAASVEFYARYANMRIVHSRPGTAWISDKSRPFAIVLIESTGKIQPLLPVAHLGIGISSKAEVDRLATIAREQGCLLAGPEESGPPIGYWAFLRDSDGHTLEIAYGQELGLSVERAV